jgi:hypothetical protein
VPSGFRNLVVKTALLGILRRLILLGDLFFIPMEHRADRADTSENRQERLIKTIELRLLHSCGPSLVNKWTIELPLSACLRQGKGEKPRENKGGKDSNRAHFIMNDGNVSLYLFR